MLSLFSLILHLDKLSCGSRAPWVHLSPPAQPTVQHSDELRPHTMKYECMAHILACMPVDAGQLADHAMPHAQLRSWLSCRPFLHLGGELDGLARMSKVALVALEAAQVAFRFGSRSVAGWCQCLHSLLAVKVHTPGLARLHLQCARMHDFCCNTDAGTASYRHMHMRHALWCIHAERHSVRLLT